MPNHPAAPVLPHPATSKTGILLLNLGTPDAPEKVALRRYLREFLSDPRVVELPRWLWQPILYGVILPFRPAKSAKKYASIWDNREGSPLRFHTEKQAKLLEGWLAQHGLNNFLVDYAMRYGNPPITTVLDRLMTQGCERIVCLPLYPQYAASSTGSALDGVYRYLLTQRRQPSLRTIHSFHDNPDYILALAKNIRDYWQKNGRPAILLMSFHGIPLRSVKLGDPYQQECLRSGQLLATELGLEPTQYRITFQSRFGRAKWLEPYTAPTLTELGRQRTSRVDVICPGFVADCLETLEEIAQEGKELFKEAGGGEFHYIPALNEHAHWIDVLGNMVERELCRPLINEAEAEYPSPP
jgi:ferrochelatase